MNADHSASHPTHGLDLETEGTGNAARHLARERQKHELRDERDRLVLDLAGGLGRQELAQRFGVTPAVIDKLLAGARNRTDVRAASSLDAGITAGRLAARGERWADADSHYAELGSQAASAPPL